MNLLKIKETRANLITQLNVAVFDSNYPLAGVLRNKLKGFDLALNLVADELKRIIDRLTKIYEGTK